MAFCASCGAQMEGRFCAKCGAVAGGGAPAGSPSASAQPAPAAEGLTENVASALCYVLSLITGILFLVLEPYNRNRNIRFHAFQSIFLGVAGFIIGIVLSVLGIVLALLGLGGVAFALHMLLWLGFVGVSIFLALKSYQGSKVSLPVIGPLAEKQA